MARPPGRNAPVPSFRASPPYNRCLQYGVENILRSMVRSASIQCTTLTSSPANTSKPTTALIASHMALPLSGFAPIKRQGNCRAEPGAAGDSWEGAERITPSLLGGARRVRG